jgi:hypothetical protein
MISRRALETATAALTASFGVAVVVSSIDNGIGWSSAGVDAGTFPFLTGLIIVAGSLYNLARGALAGTGVVISRVDLRRLAALFIPATVFIAMIPMIGMYLASACYVFGVLALPRHRPFAQSLAIAAATPLVLYVVFERLFQVTLPHGALVAAAGF